MAKTIYASTSAKLFSRTKSSRFISNIEPTTSTKQILTTFGAALEKASGEPDGSRYWFPCNNDPAVHTIVALDKRETVFPMLLERFEKSLDDNDHNDIFSNVLLIAELGDPRGKNVFEILKKRFAGDANAMNAIEQFESTYKNEVKKNMKTKAHSSEITSEWQTTEARQFDFWIGKWDVNLRAIQNDLSWKDTTQAKVEIYPILDGKAILKLWDSQTIKGFSLRYFDPEKGKWVLYLNWPNEKESSSNSLEGEFRHGRGEFFSKRDGTISRYTFCDVSPTSLRWDDAYSKDGGKTWTYDWIMEFSRTAAIPTWPNSSPNALTFAKEGTRCRGNEAEFAKIASFAGQWTGEVELVEKGKEPTKSIATARAYRILDGCATILFLQFQQGEKTFCSFSMLTYNSTKKRFEELRLDNRQESVAAVLSGNFSGGDLNLAVGGDSPLQSVWQVPISDGNLKLVVHQTESGIETQHTYVLKKAPIKEAPQETELQLADAINETCPRSGKPVVANSLTTYRGFTVGFCNQHCRDDFASDMENCEMERKFFDDIIGQRK